MLSNTEVGDLENPFYTGKKWHNAVFKKTGLLKLGNFGNSFQSFQFDNDENHNMGGGREWKSRISDKLLGAVKLWRHFQQCWLSVWWQSYKKIRATLFCSCTDLLMVNDSGKLSEVMWLSAEYSACRCSKCVFSNPDQVMFQFLPFRHLARDQPASQVLNPFKDLPISFEVQSNSPGCGT